MATDAAFKRLKKEYKAIMTSPPPLVMARPLENNILEWHYLLRGPPDTPYHTGYYWGKLIFPREYPFKPPSIRMLTPSGRFKPGERICLSISDFHPDTWNPAWSVATILSGLLSFMASEETGAGTVSSSTAQRKHYAKVSHQWNKDQRHFQDVFSDICTEAPNEDLLPGLQATSDAKVDGEVACVSPRDKPPRARSRNYVDGHGLTIPATAAAVGPRAPAPSSVTKVLLRYKWYLLGLLIWVYLFMSRIAARLSTIDT